MWLANLTLTQVFVSLSLTAGLTQMWSVGGVAFYLLLPTDRSLHWSVCGETLHACVSRRSSRWGGQPRLGLVRGLPAAVRRHRNQELGVSGTSRGSRRAWCWPRSQRAPKRPTTIGSRIPGGCGSPSTSARNRRLMGAFVVAYGLACTRSPDRRPRRGHRPPIRHKMVLGAIVALRTPRPLVCAQGPFRFLGFGDAGPRRWSYGIFIWHLAVLAIVFPCSASSPSAAACPGLLITVT